VNFKQIMNLESKTTLVTAFFDIGKRENNTKRKQADSYLKLAEYIYSIDQPVIFFVDTEFELEVREKRCKYPYLTQIVPIALEDVKHYSKIETIRNAHKNMHVQN